MNTEHEILSSNATGKELKEFLNEVPSGKLESVKRSFMSETGATSTIFKNWRLGITPVPLPSRKLINLLAIKEFGKPVFKIEEYEVIEYISIDDYRATGIKLYSRSEVIEYVSKADFKGYIVNTISRDIVCEFSKNKIKYDREWKGISQKQEY